MRLFQIGFLLTLALNGHAAQAKPSFKKIIIVVLENADAANAVKQPFLKSLAQRGVLLNAYSGITHPSEPNYIAMIAGDSMGVTDDGMYSFDAHHLGDMLESKGLTWKNYAEDYPKRCFVEARKAKYARKHVPFLSFKNVSTDTKRCKLHIVNASELDSDIKKNTLPDFALYTPNMSNDGHDTGVVVADKWLRDRFGPLIENPKFMKDELLVVTFDENDGTAGNRIATILYGSSVKSSTVVETPYNHYSLLRTIEDRFELGNLGKNDATAKAFDGFWK